MENTPFLLICHGGIGLIDGDKWVFFIHTTVTSIFSMVFASVSRIANLIAQTLVEACAVNLMQGTGERLLDVNFDPA